MKQTIFYTLLILTVCTANISAQNDRRTKQLTFTDPVLERKAVEDDKGSDGKTYIKVTLGIKNYDDYKGLFYRARQVCGDNKDASRGWVNIFNAETGAQIYRYCNFQQSTDLQNLRFMVTREDLPKGVFVVFEDRDQAKNYQSNCVNLSDGKPCANKPTKFVLGKNVTVENIGKIKPENLTVLQKPDLRIDGWFMSLDNNTFTVRFQNACKTPIKASFPVTLYIYEGKTNSTKTIFGETKKVDSLNGGFHTFVEFNISKVAKGKDIRGTHLIQILLDSGNYIAEENEKNNEASVNSVNESLFPELPCKQ